MSFGAFAQGETLYVDDDAPPGGKGTSWISAFQHLSDALAVTSNFPVPVEIRVAQGEYSPNGPGIYDPTATFEVPEGAVLLGGFYGIPRSAVSPMRPVSANERNPALYETILTGDQKRDDPPLGFQHYRDNSHHVVTVRSPWWGCYGVTVIDGFTIKGGNAIDAPSGAGGGVLLDGPEGIIIFNACHFARNRAVAGGGVGSGDFWDITVTDSLFTSNAALERGGAMWDGVKPWSSTFINVEFVGNSADGEGGAYYAGHEGHSELVSCAFRGNEAEEGGAIFNDNQRPMITTNCEFAGNSATWRGGAISSLDTSMTITNSTIVGNFAVDEGGGLYFGDFTYADSSKLQNNIIWFNCALRGCQVALGPAGQFGSGGGLWVDFQWTDLQGGLGAVYVSPALNDVQCVGSHVVDENPRFDQTTVPASPAQWAEANLSLARKSPCINGANTKLVPLDEFDLDGDGNTTEYLPFDLAGNPRVRGDSVDHGAYEAPYRTYELHYGEHEAR